MLDFIDNFSLKTKNLVIIETGGMKGRRKEITREELHDKLKKGFNSNNIKSEYGMTELFSQAYSFSDGIFVPAKTMRVLLREVNDPFSLVKTPGKVGGIKVIDLANIESCSFVETKDLGSLEEDGIQFKVLGRFDNSEMRGCSMMVSAP